MMLSSSGSSSLRPARAALYVRSASAMKPMMDGPVHQQVSELRTYVGSQGWTIQGEYLDPGISGLKFDRPGLTRLLEACRGGEVDVVVVTDHARISRDLTALLALLERLESLGIRVVALRTHLHSVHFRSGVHKTTD